MQPSDEGLGSLCLELEHAAQVLSAAQVPSAGGEQGRRRLGGWLGLWFLHRWQGKDGALCWAPKITATCPGIPGEVSSHLRKTYFLS